MLSLMVTVRLAPTFLLLKLPAVVRFTTSLVLPFVTTPTSVPLLLKLAAVLLL